MTTNKAEKKVTSADVTKRPFLTLDEAAGEIPCTRRFIEMRIEDGEIPVFRPSNRLVRIARTDFEAWIARFTSSATTAASTPTPEVHASTGAEIAS